MKILICIALLLAGCSRHGFMMNNSVLGMPESDLYERYGKSVIRHPIDDNVLFYFESHGKKLHWARIEIKGSKVSRYDCGFVNGRPKIAAHVKPALVKTKWISELFSYIGSASAV